MFVSAINKFKYHYCRINDKYLNPWIIWLWLWPVRVWEKYTLKEVNFLNRFDLIQNDLITLVVSEEWPIKCFLWIQLSGNIVAPATKSEYSGSHLNTWIGFSFVNGLIISGKGTIDGRGSMWWKQPCLGNPSPVSQI